MPLLRFSARQVVTSCSMVTPARAQRSDLRYRATSRNVFIVGSERAQAAVAAAAFGLSADPTARQGWGVTHLSSHDQITSKLGPQKRRAHPPAPGAFADVGDSPGDGGAAGFSSDDEGSESGARAAAGQ